eukprot:scaffold1006_cov270-Pinguiococcus_pyrenoidosus.AAC.33
MPRSTAERPSLATAASLARCSSCASASRTAPSTTSCHVGLTLGSDQHRKGHGVLLADPDRVRLRVVDFLVQLDESAEIRLEGVVRRQNQILRPPQKLLPRIAAPSSSRLLRVRGARSRGGRRCGGALPLELLALGHNHAAQVRTASLVQRRFDQLLAQCLGHDGPIHLQEAQVADGEAFPAAASHDERSALPDGHGGSARDRRQDGRLARLTPDVALLGGDRGLLGHLPQDEVLAAGQGFPQLRQLLERQVRRLRIAAVSEVRAQQVDVQTHRRRLGAGQDPLRVHGQLARKSSAVGALGDPLGSEVGEDVLGVGLPLDGELLRLGELLVERGEAHKPLRSQPKYFCRRDSCSLYREEVPCEALHEFDVSVVPQRVALEVEVRALSLAVETAVLLDFQDPANLTGG